MKPRGDGGVVNSELKVYGVQGLRIVDASIMPIVPDQHTQGPVYMIAGKTASLIRSEYDFENFVSGIRYPMIGRNVVVTITIHND